ncbi:hypothetical protein VIGAN_04233700 [Vigna angularis var. angularis]|uniref:Secreted protein n=1 Tax=Vigna angularis var. angularis TaxID=157739 RepID=A0A0S3RW98_PHAAN|nr:hypothetical protein VIGAN_04233700 [Vigna angularis var. angularis]
MAAFPSSITMRRDTLFLLDVLSLLLSEKPLLSGRCWNSWDVIHSPCGREVCVPSAGCLLNVKASSWWLLDVLDCSFQLQRAPLQDGCLLACRDINAPAPFTSSCTQQDQPRELFRKPCLSLLE